MAFLYYRIGYYIKNNFIFWGRQKHETPESTTSSATLATSAVLSKKVVQHRWHGALVFPFCWRYWRSEVKQWRQPEFSDHTTPFWTGQSWIRSKRILMTLMMTKRPSTVSESSRENSFICIALYQKHHLENWWHRWRQAESASKFLSPEITQKRPWGGCCLLVSAFQVYMVTHILTININTLERIANKLM